jgi:hypothetical protein
MPNLYPKQSDGKCELQITKKQPYQLFCKKGPNCRGKCKCILYSVPFGKPDGKWKVETAPVSPKADRYYFCRCECPEADKPKKPVRPAAPKPPSPKTVPPDIAPVPGPDAPR